MHSSHTVSEIPSYVNYFACHLPFQVTNEPAAQMLTQHAAISHALNIVFRKMDIFFHNAPSNVLFIKTGHIEMCAV